MCFYDQYIFACGDWKWGNFRQHCQKEYRQGETCGMKLVNGALGVDGKCKMCEKIDTKLRRKKAEEDRVARWKAEGGKYRASIEKSEAAIRALNYEIHTLETERRQRSSMVGSTR
ncbi:hypothetical protein FH972_023155 [Carpinus fangiana]|uniref:Uncharacterized protein n=1 Tax=Carpinus fangiana TaxID=176857 RepID=A0A5N6KUS7_9ROSI|nr:hypothetical protein FH972_023155 [Carpinus fangiana]